MKVPSGVEMQALVIVNNLIKDLEMLSGFCEEHDDYALICNKFCEYPEEDGVYAFTMGDACVCMTNDFKEIRDKIIEG